MFNAAEVEIEDVIRGVPCGRALVAKADYLSIANYPNWSKEQRYEERIKKKRGNFLIGEFVAPMREIAIGVLNGCPYLLNANTRQWCIIDGHLKNSPEFFSADVYFCKSSEELDFLFSTFDSKNAVDSSKDIQAYALKATNLVLTSALKHNFLTSVLVARSNGSAGGSSDIGFIINVTREYEKPLRLLDLTQFDVASHGRRTCSVPVFGSALAFLKEKDSRGLPAIEAFQARDAHFKPMYDILEGYTEEGLMIPLTNTNHTRRTHFTNWLELFRTYNA